MVLASLRLTNEAHDISIRNLLTYLSFKNLFFVKW